MGGKHKKSDLFKIFNILKSKLKLKHKILLRRIKLFDCGECSLDNEDETLRIVIDKSLNEQSQIDTLIHEYAHALRMDRHDDVCDHSKKWGIEYARVWRCYEREYLKIND